MRISHAFYVKIDNVIVLVMLPFWISGVGIVASMVGYYTVGAKEKASQKDLLFALHKGLFSTSITIIGFSAIIIAMFFDGRRSEGWSIFGCIGKTHYLLVGAAILTPTVTLMRTTLVDLLELHGQACLSHINLLFLSLNSNWAIFRCLDWSDYRIFHILCILAHPIDCKGQCQWLWYRNYSRIRNWSDIKFFPCPCDYYHHSCMQ